MSVDRQEDLLVLERRLRSILGTIIEQSSAFDGLQPIELEDVIVGRVIDSVGVDGLNWQSHELISQLRSTCLECGVSEWEHAFRSLLCWPHEDAVSDYTVDRMATKLGQLGSPVALEASVANTFLRCRWPGTEGLTPTVPFRFLRRRIEVESIFGREASVAHVGDRILREIEWVSGSVVVSGAFEGSHRLPQQEAWQRWQQIRSRIQGFLEAQHQPPEIVWEIAAVPQPVAGQLFSDPRQMEQQEKLVISCCEADFPISLRIRVPLPIPSATRQMLARCLRSRISPEIVWDAQPELSIVAGMLQQLPTQGIHAVCQRTLAFDSVVADGAAPPWQGDWIRAREQFCPLWLSNERVIPPSSVDYFLRNSAEIRPFPVIAIEPFSVEKCRKDAEKLLQKISRRRGGGWDRFEELLRGAAISPRLLAPATDRA
ncbi:MAG: hypothetical protein AAEJ04_02760 [Planctomycetota bacterium]